VVVIGFENICSLIHIKFRLTKPLMSKNDSKYCVYLFPIFFLWFAQRDTSHNHPCATIYGHFNNDMVHTPGKQGTKSGLEQCRLFSWARAVSSTRRLDMSEILPEVLPLCRRFVPPMMHMGSKNSHEPIFR